MKRFDMEIQPQQYYMGEGESYAVSPYESNNGEWVQWDDVEKLEESHAKMVELLKEARHVCAYPDRNTDLLDEIDALLNKLGETDLPELN